MSISKPGSKLYSITAFKCPKCHQGDLFEGPAFNTHTAFKMKPHCDNCGQRYVLEPGFYWGAMYVAYGLASGFLLVTFGILFFVFGLSWKLAFAIDVILIALLYVLVFRLSRSIWINIYVNYNPERA